MTEIEDDLEQVEADEAQDDQERSEEPLSELVEQVGRDTGTLVRREVELATSRRLPAIRRAGRDLTLAAVAVVAFVTAFVLASWAAVIALSKVVPNWLAPLVLAAAWVGLGATLLVSLRHRYRGIGEWTGDPEDVVKEREQVRDEAESDLRASLDDLAGAIADQAGELVHNAVVPAADGVIDAGESILDAADDVTDSIEDAVPGGGLVNGVIDLALLPGRMGVKAARAALGRDSAKGDANGHDTTSKAPDD